MTLNTGIKTLAFAMALSNTSAYAALADFAGVWENTDPNTRGITKMVLRTAGDTVRVHTFAQCRPADCDWGLVQGTAYAASATESPARIARAVTAEYQMNFAVTVLVMQAKGDRMRVEAYTRFTDNSNRSNYMETYTLRKTGGGGGFGAGAGNRPRDYARFMEGQDCTAFNTAQVRVQGVGGRWKIAVGNTILLDFTRNRGAAEQALRVIRGLRLDSQCFVGRPNPSFEYYLSKNDAPQGAVPSEDCTGFNPATIRVRRVNNSWKITDGMHWMFDFGAKVDEARETYRIIKRYRFSQSCFVGRPSPSMRYLKR